MKFFTVLALLYAVTTEAFRVGRLINHDSKISVSRKSLRMMSLIDAIDPIIQFHHTHLIHQHASVPDVHALQAVLNNLFLISDGDAAVISPIPAETVATEAASVYSKVDKTGFIGFIATYVEYAIDAGHDLFSSMGIKNNYGYSIVLFTVLGRHYFH